MHTKSWNKSLNKCFSGEMSFCDLELGHFLGRITFSDFTWFPGINHSTPLASRAFALINYQV